MGERIARGRDSPGNGRPAMVAPRDGEGQGKGDAATARGEGRAASRPSNSPRAGSRARG